MKKAFLIAVALGALSLPALAQQSPTGQSSGGPARVGVPGQTGGGVPGTTPNVSGGGSAGTSMDRGSAMEGQRMAPARHSRKHSRKSRRSKRAM
jgi:hypothetical protein